MLACLTSLTSEAARAEAPARPASGLRLHVEGAAAHALGEFKQEQFGWGGSGLVAPELVLSKRLGIELPVGITALSPGRVPEGYAPPRTGVALFAMPGIRLRPFGGSFGPWVAAGVGLAQTNSKTRGGFGARVGMDVRAGGVAVGPHVGYLHVIEPKGGVRPEDARIALFGLHAAFFGNATKAPPPLRRRDLDPDRDGLASAADLCPDRAEDRDGIADLDGCPEEDADRDRLADASDRCPDEAEDYDGAADFDGCPEKDADGDRVADASDACPDSAEDRDGLADFDGCPEEDADGDRIADGSDACPGERETDNGVQDEDGCPDAEGMRVQGDWIELEDRIRFALNRAEVRPESYPVLDRLAMLLSANPSYALVHVSGHADERGELLYNERLSEARARAVRDLLVARGVDANRLTTEGYGARRPRERGRNEAAFAKNRRVEFRILQRDEALPRPARAPVVAPRAGAGSDPISARGETK